MSLKRLTVEDHSAVLELFGQNWTDYGFLLDRLVRHSYTDVIVYGEFQGGQLASLLMNNDNNLSYYGRSARDVQIYQTVLPELSYRKLSGPRHFIDAFVPFINVQSSALSHLGVVKQVVKSGKRVENVKPIETKKELGMHYDLLMSTSEFKNGLPETKADYVEQEWSRLKQATDRIVYLELNGQMVSACATVSEGVQSAIVIGVVTDPAYRNHGFGTEVLIALFTQLLAENKYPYLFYNNPRAKSVYQSIGMTEVCEWKVVEVSP